MDYFENFPPCPSVTSIRLWAALACDLDWDIVDLDAEQAFVQSDQDEEVYIRLPKGCGSIPGKV